MTCVRFYIPAHPDTFPNTVVHNPLATAIYYAANDSATTGSASPYTTTAERCDLFLLPLNWKHYHTDAGLAFVCDVARQAARLNKLVAVWHCGDLGPIIPFGNALILQNSLKRSRRHPNRFAAPYFCDDPLPSGDEHVACRDKPLRPHVGFCGYARISPLKALYAICCNLRDTANFYCGMSHLYPPRIIPATLLRARVLESLSRCSAIATSFIIRTSYRGGAKDPVSLAATVREFFRNIQQTDYTVCIRGYGNWSMRFFETLACGRIPIVIDTDVSLPFDFSIDWQHYCVWIPERDIPFAATKLIAFHERLTNTQFQVLQQECRRIWLERFTHRGFLAHFHEYLHARFSRDPNATGAPMRHTYLRP